MSVDAEEERPRAGEFAFAEESFTGFFVNKGMSWNLSHYSDVL